MPPADTSAPRETFLTSFDGTQLKLYSYGNPKRRPMVLVNGIGATRAAWKYVIERFSADYHIITWDYRGLFDSGSAPNIESYRMADHAEDLATILKAGSHQAPVLIGWSMGVQVVLEFHRNYGDLPHAFVALNGAPGHMLNKAFEHPIKRKVIDGLLKAGAYATESVGFLASKLKGKEPVIGGLFSMIGKLGALSPDADAELMKDLMREWLCHDMRIIAAILSDLADHDPSDLLPSVSTPTLVLGGSDDPFTTQELVDRTADGIRGAIRHVVPQATHFGLFEYPVQVNNTIENFLNGLKTSAVS